MSQFDLRNLRNAFGTFLTGVTIVATREESGIPRGFTANSFTSVSLDPPLLLVCIGKAADSVDVFRNAGGFSVNILSEDQMELSDLFASKRPDKFDIADWKSGDAGYPVLSGVTAWFECEHHKVVDAGDHIIVIGKVVGYDFNAGIGLGYVRGGYMSLGLERSVAKKTGIASNTIVGAIIDIDGKVWLSEDPETGEIYVPAVGLHGDTGSLAKFQESMEKEGIRASISSLFAVFESEENHQQSIYYRARGETDRDVPGFYAFDDIPWDRITSNAIEIMLRRYVAESRRQRYGIYFGSDKGGYVRTFSEEHEE